MAGRVSWEREGFRRNTVGPPEWECEAMGSEVWVQCATFEEGIFAPVTCVMDIASNPSALMPLKTCSSVFVHSYLCVYGV